ncbi:hypothetical protein VTK26DRAFT_9153 [Humicola hyalothermophila]
MQQTRECRRPRGFQAHGSRNKLLGGEIALPKGYIYDGGPSAPQERPAADPHPAGRRLWRHAHILLLHVGLGLQQVASFLTLARTKVRRPALRRPPDWDREWRPRLSWRNTPIWNGKACCGRLRP